jgi:regulator of RNase E activity RraA
VGLVSVEQDDYIVADEDGIVAVPSDQVEQVEINLEVVAAVEAEVVQLIDQGGSIASIMSALKRKSPH